MVSDVLVMYITCLEHVFNIHVFQYTQIHSSVDFFLRHYTSFVSTPFIHIHYVCSSPIGQYQNYEFLCIVGLISDLTPI